MLKGFRFPNSLEGIAQDRLDQIDYAKSDSAIGFDPVMQILAKLRVEHGLPLNGSGQGASPPATGQRRTISA